MHLIHRQIIELECSSEQQALHWQRELVQVFENRLTHELERMLDRFADKDQMIQIEHLSLNLGALNGSDFRESFVSAVLEQLPKQLEESIKSLDINNFTKGHHNSFETFTYFLKNGTLPWWSGSISLPQMANDALEQMHFMPQNQAITKLRKALQSYKSRERLILQFGTAFWEKLLQTIAPDRWNLVNNWSELLLQLLSTQVNISATQEKSLRNCITNVILHPEQPQIKLFLTKVIQKLNIKSEFIYIAEQQQSGKIVNNLSAEIITSVLEPLQEIKSDTSTDLSESFDIKLFTNNEIFIYNAGLVLLAPFLLEYLKACGVANDEQLIDQERAVHYLQYLVTSEKITPEYELTLNKLLCAMPLDVPISLEVEFSAEALEQADSLLNSVIRYWEVLKNTSIESLQESFLQRPGKLSRRDDGWLLQVEQQSYDMLLEHLPWGYSIIKLPWMPEMLWVEWM